MNSWNFPLLYTVVHRLFCIAYEYTDAVNLLTLCRIHAFARFVLQRIELRLSNFFFLETMTKSPKLLKSTAPSPIGGSSVTTATVQGSVSSSQGQSTTKVYTPHTKMGSTIFVTTLSKPETTIKFISIYYSKSYYWIHYTVLTPPILVTIFACQKSL